MVAGRQVAASAGASMDEQHIPKVYADALCLSAPIVCGLGEAAIRRVKGHSVLACLALGVFVPVGGVIALLISEVAVSDSPKDVRAKCRIPTKAGRAGYRTNA